MCQSRWYTRRSREDVLFLSVQVNDETFVQFVMERRNCHAHCPEVKVNEIRATCTKRNKELTSTTL